MRLRAHQRAVVDVCREILGGAPIREVVLSVTPGGGKSFVPVILADNLIPAVAEKICWIVPRNALKYQGEAEFGDPRWSTPRRIRAADNGVDLSRGLDGYITTYQAIGSNPECHAAEFKRRRYILFLDEIHHVADGSTWHRALAPLGERAALTVKASGTLSRGDGRKVAFIDYGADGLPSLADGGSRRVITYGRRRAISDGAILPVEFRTVDGDAEWEELDGTRGESSLSGEDGAKALFTALRTEFADSLLDASLAEFSDMRREYPDAKLLVVAPNIEVARAYHAHLAAGGHGARIATSDDTPLARRNIEAFRRGAYRVLVTVAMAYEGLNVPEVAVICCLSHIRSVPWLEQCFARANRPATGKTRAVVYAPADWAFKKAVRDIRAERFVPLGDGQGELTGDSERPQGESGAPRPWIIPISSSADIGGRPNAPARENPPCPPSEAEKILRKNVSGTVAALLADAPPGSRQARGRMLRRRMRLVVDKQIAEMTASELEAVWMWLRSKYLT